MVDTSKYPSSPSFSWALARRAFSWEGSRRPKLSDHVRGESGFQVPPGFGFDFGINVSWSLFSLFSLSLVVAVDSSCVAENRRTEFLFH